MLLCAAWLSWLGPGATSAGASWTDRARCGGPGTRSWRVYWRGPAARRDRARADGGRRRFPVPDGDAARALILLDVALVTTDPAGAPAAPAPCCADWSTRRGSADPAVAAFVGLVADLAGHPEARRLIAAVARSRPRPAAEPVGHAVGTARLLPVRRRPVARGPCGRADSAR